jgi:hypothetical protein
VEEGGECAISKCLSRSATILVALTTANLVRNNTRNRNTRRRVFYVNPFSSLLVYCYTLRSAVEHSPLYGNDDAKEVVRRFSPAMAIYRANNPKVVGMKMFVLLGLGTVRCTTGRLDGFIVEYPYAFTPEPIVVQDVNQLLKSYHVATDINLDLKARR